MLHIHERKGEDETLNYQQSRELRKVIKKPPKKKRQEHSIVVPRVQPSRACRSTLQMGSEIQAFEVWREEHVL